MICRRCVREEIPHVSLLVQNFHCERRFICIKSISTLGQKGRLSKCALKGSSMHWFLFRVALPHRYLHTVSSTRIIFEKLSGVLLDSPNWHDSLDRKWMRPQNVGAARERSPARIVSGAGSLKSSGIQGRGIGEGWGTFFSKAASKGLPRPFNAAGWRCSKVTLE